MRRSRRDSIGIRAWLIGLGVPLVLLFGFFSLMPYSVLIKLDRFHIHPIEADRLARWFDQRPGQHVQVKMEELDISAPRIAGAKCTLDDPSAIERPMIFSAEGYHDTASVRRVRTTEGAWLVVFHKDRLFRSQRSIVLLPATPFSIRAKYAQVMCDELRLVAPEISFVRLRICDRDQGVFLKEERISTEFLEKRNRPDAVLWQQGFAADRPDLRLPEVKRDQHMAELIRSAEDRVAQGDVSLLDTNAFAAFMLLQCAEQRRDLLLDNGSFIYGAANGKASPLYHAERGEGVLERGQELGAFGFGALIGSQRMQSDVIVLADRLRSDSIRICDRLSAVDQLWLPMLAQTSGIGRARAEAAQVREAFLHRLFHPDPSFFGSAEAVEIQDGAASTVAANSLPNAWLDKFRSDPDTIRFPRGSYDIDRDLIVPRGMSVVMEKGARFDIVSGKSIVINGALIVRGTGLNPVFIRAVGDNGPFGSIAVQGDGSTRCSIQGLRISGGSEAWIDGQYHSGMLSFHACDVEMDRCVIQGSHADDAVNIKHGHVSIRDCEFREAHADMLDLDFVKGSVERCSFNGEARVDTTRYDPNGDGLDVSASHVLVRECSFIAMPDKGLSIGETSQVIVLGSTFDHDHLAIAVKDLSVAHVDASTFTNNERVFAVYQKKPVFGGAFLTLYNNTFTDNAHEREVDKSSTIITREEHDATVWRSFGLQP